MSNIKFMYVRNPWKKRDITIVSDIVESEGKVFVKTGWAFRSNHDKFIKKEGRNLALERMNSSDEDYSEVLEIGKKNYYDIALVILSHIYNKYSTPRKYLNDISWEIQYRLMNSNISSKKEVNETQAD